jgi:hypothetical protein
MTKEEVVTLMTESKSEDEWNRNCDLVKYVFDGYPDWWFEAIILSGIAARTKMRWP